MWLAVGGVIMEDCIMPAMAGTFGCTRLSPLIHRETVKVNVLPSVPHEEVKNVVLGPAPDLEHMAYIREEVGDPFDATVDFVWSHGSKCNVNI